MPEFEEHGWQGLWMPGRRVSGQHGVAVIVKRRFEVDMMEAKCVGTVTGPVALVAEDYDDIDPPNVSPRHPSEMWVEKPNVDILVRGTAYAPGGKAVPQFDVELRIPRVLQRRLRIFGDRHLIWYPPLKWLTKEDLMKGEVWIWPDPDFSEPQPIDKLPLRYEYAYGGWAKIILSDEDQETAEEEQAKAAVVEERREKKKEIEKKLKKADAEKNKPKEKKPPGITDDKAAEIAKKAFLIDEGIDLKLDDETKARLDKAESQEEKMKIVSAFRLGQHMAERPEDDAKKDEDEEKDDEEGEDEEEEEEEEKKESEVDKFFSDGKTGAIDLNKLKEDDEFKALLEERAVGEARKLKDEEGTLRDRATEFGDIKLHDGDWASAYMRARPEKKKKKKEEGEHPEMPYPANLTGKGFVVGRLEAAVDKVPLPNIEDPDELLNNEGYITDLNEFDLKKLKAPAGWGPYAIGWYPRAQYWGVYFWDLDLAKAAIDKVKDEYDPDDPDDKKILEMFAKLETPMMNPLAFQEAHPKMQVKELRGDEEIYLTNLTPEGTLFFRLPGVHPTVTIDMSKGPEFVRMRLDTMLIDVEDPKKPAVELCWRGWAPIKDFKQLDVFPVKKVRIIEVDQENWVKIQQKQAKVETGLSEDGLTSTIKAITDEDLEAMGGGAEEAYKAQFKKKRDGFGAKRDDVVDAFVFDQDQDRQLHGDEWDESIRKEKEQFVEEQKKKADELEKLRDKKFKAEARELADEEFGIVRDPETGEILAVDPPEPKGGKKKKKK